MRVFDYSRLPDDLLTEEIINSVSLLHEHRGRQSLFLEQRADELQALCDIAKIQSTGASNRIEGIFTSEKRLRELVHESIAPKSRAEEEIIGYRDVLNLIHESHDAIPVTPNSILQLHQILFRPTAYSIGGKWKDSDNAIVEIDAQGKQHIRFRPLPAVAVPNAMEQLCSTYNEAMAAGKIDALLLAALFTFDFICIHPFNDGNGRMSRLLTLLMLYRSGYLVGKYVSIEHEIERTKETYYEALQASSAGWDENKNDSLPFVSYQLGCIISACRIFEERLEGVAIGKMSKPERIEAFMKRSIGKVTKADILKACPDISPTTANRALADLLSRGLIEKLGAGRGSGYRWIG